MREFTGEEASKSSRTLDQSEIETVSGGHAKIIRTANMGYFGIMHWFDNGAASYIYFGQGEAPGSSTMHVYTEGGC